MGKLKNDAVIAAIKDLNGNLTAVARRFDVSRTTVYTHLERYKTAAEALAEARETMIDNVESSLYRNALAGENTAMIFFLKTQAKHRGYVERQEVTGGEGGPLTVKIVYEDADPNT